MPSDIHILTYAKDLYMLMLLISGLQSMGVIANMNREDHNHLNGEEHSHLRGKEHNHLIREECSQMHEEEETQPAVSHIKPEGQTFQKVARHQSCVHQSPSQGAPKLLASASSPSLLSGCGDSSTRTGACIEKHILAHHVPVTDAPAMCQHADAASSQISFPSSPLSFGEGDPPASLFLTPSITTARHSHSRPVSAPPHHLERISGMLLRLVGDHYLCTTCGRQLRNIGDELTLETSLRRILSSDDLVNDIATHYNR